MIELILFFFLWERRGLIPKNLDGDVLTSGHGTRPAGKHPDGVCATQTSLFVLDLIHRMLDCNVLLGVESDVFDAL